MNFEFTIRNTWEEQEGGVRQAIFTVFDLKGRAVSSKNGAVIVDE